MPRVAIVLVTSVLRVGASPTDSSMATLTGGPAAASTVVDRREIDAKRKKCIEVRCWRM
jgi:hypothetical protein